jgi:hypothetical protein
MSTQCQLSRQRFDRTCATRHTMDKFEPNNRGQSNLDALFFFEIAERRQRLPLDLRDRILVRAENSETKVAIVEQCSDLATKQ